MGLLIAATGIIAPILDDGDATFTVLALPLGICLMITKEKCIINFEGDQSENTEKK